MQRLQIHEFVRRGAEWGPQMIDIASRLQSAVDYLRGHVGLGSRQPNADMVFKPAPAAATLSADEPEPVSTAELRRWTPPAITIIATILIFHVLYFAASLLLPIAMAALLTMMLAPVVQLVERSGMPRAIAAALVVLSALVVLVVGAALLAAPLQIWIERVPHSFGKLEEQLQQFRRPLDDLAKATEQLQEATNGRVESGPQKVVVVRPPLSDLMLGTPHVLASMFSIFFLLFFLLAAGDTFLRKLVVIIPTFKEKKRAVEIIRTIEGDISFYLMTFAAINVALGVVMGLVTAILGIPNPLLWGVMVAVFNFVPFIGAATSIGTLAVVGLITFDSIGWALVAPGIMLALAAISSELVTPLVLGRGLRLNPVAIFIAIMVWGWLWGIAGVLLAVPLLASFKIVCERIKSLAPIAEFLTTYEPANSVDG